MSNCLDPTNRSALQFNLESLENLKQICKPMLNEEFGINNFNYCRTFDNGTRLYLNTNSEWVNYYVAHNFQDDTDHQETYAPGDDLYYALWTGFKEDKVFSVIRNHFDWWHGFSIYERGENYVDSFDFAARKDCDQAVNYYLNNIDFLREQIGFFKKKATHLIDPSDKRKLMVSKKWKPFNKTTKNSLLDPHRVEIFMTQINKK